MEYKDSNTLSKREYNRINCREMLLKASRRLFTTKGYDETTMGDIAEKAGVSKATVYNYFPNKESLLIGTVNEVLDQEADFLSDEQYSALDFEQKLRKMLALIILCTRKYPGLARRIVYLNSCEDSTLYGSGDRMFSILTTLVEDAKKDGHFRQDLDTDIVVDTFIGLIYMVLFQWTDIAELEEEKLRQRLDVYINVILNGLRTGDFKE